MRLNEELLTALVNQTDRVVSVVVVDRHLQIEFVDDCMQF